MDGNRFSDRDGIYDKYGKGLSRSGGISSKRNDLWLKWYKIQDVAVFLFSLAWWGMLAYVGVSTIVQILQHGFNLISYQDIYGPISSSW